MALLTAGLLAGSASAASSTPLKGTYVQSGGPPSGAPGCLFVNNTSGSGHVTHLGKSLWAGTACVNVNQMGQISVTDGHLTLTAANGDKLYSIFTAQGGVTGTDGTFHLDGQFRVVRGTGRFAGAKGGGTFTDDGGLGGTPSTIKITGTLQRAH